MTLCVDLESIINTPTHKKEIVRNQTPQRVKLIKSHKAVIYSNYKHIALWEFI
ncbi:hypothetical protein F383_10368 [Gossypium arboreum]|uniref:Uncharacterized protein n=1 Tax=Gossypium arboreum TaxID=29729 RepID=A0A0B0PFJ7_GOSAR|nr:hypothetical protein F383_10368 [Gossypium arboreum]